MKKSSLLFLFALSAWSVQAQVLNNSRVHGKLVENQSQHPLGFASVGLFSAKDSSLVKGANSAENGKFELTELPAGNYYLKINQVGFTPKIVPNLMLSAATPQLDLGTITVASAAKKLSEVEVVTQKNLVEQNLDKQVINVSKDMTAVGGTAADALKNVPSVAVDIDGNVSMRGSSNITVLVDGKNTGQNTKALLSTTPASAIEKIEVMTNPSAKYDAEGMGGIINIILKKEKKPGLNGNVMLNLGSSNNYNANLSLNYNVKKFNFFANYDFMQNDRESNFQSISYRRGFSQEQQQTADRLSRMHIPRFGFDYQLSERQSITVSTKTFINNMTDKEAINNTEVTERNNYYTRFGRNEIK